MMTLSMLSIGESARVLQVLDPVGEVGSRLMEMGIIPGTTLTLVGQAPLGDPLVIQVRGFQLSLRRSEAEGIEVAREAAIEG